MKLVRVLVISTGAEASLLPALKGLSTADLGAQCEFTEMRAGFPCSEPEAEQLTGTIGTWKPALVLLALPSGPVGEPAAGFFELARTRKWTMPVVVWSRGVPSADAERLMELGAVDVWAEPLGAERVAARILGLVDDPCGANTPVRSLRAKLGLRQIIGESPAFQAALKQLPQIARYQACVLLLGETGTGKEVFARAIHYHGTRSAKPFIPVNCGAIPVDLLENEFFGHESGAFTSAGSARRGLLSEADGGTLFLDEVDCLPALAQVKLLRFLQDGQFRPLGGERSCSADVRVIAASNGNLQEAIESGRFRKDLYYRLNVLSLKLPPLRERGQDIPLLARHFLANYAAKFDAPAREFSPEALQKLVCYHWPGNVRELENVIQRAVVLAGQPAVGPEDIGIGEPAAALENRNFRSQKARAIAEFEQTFVRRLLAAHSGNITKAAASAGKDRRAFWELMRKHQISTKPAAASGAPAAG